MATKKTKTTVVAKPKIQRADAAAMLHATQRANGGKSTAYYYGGNLGDSIERRYGDGYSFLGGGPVDGNAGMYGTGNTYMAQGYGNYFGAGQDAGPFTRFGPWGDSIGAGGFQYLRRFSGNAAFNHSIIASCIIAYFGYGVVKNVVDLYSDFAIEGLDIDHKDKSTRNFYRTWMRKVNLRDRIHRFMLDLFLTANVFIHRHWAKLSDADKKELRKATGNIQIINGNIIVEDESGYRELKPSEEQLSQYLALHKQIAPPSTIATSPLKDNEPLNKKRMLPWDYTSLNPLQMEMRGSKFKGENYWIIALDKKDTGEIGKMNPSFRQDLGSTKVNLPAEFEDRLKNYDGNGAGYSYEIKLDKEELSVIQDRKFDYWDWAVPFVFPALKSISFKDCLRNMEMKACATVINSIFLFKLGNTDEGRPADPDAFERLADMLQMPAQNMNILWNDDIEVQPITADVSKLFDPKKHESADKDILTALGVPEVLVGGRGSNFSNSFIGIATVLEKINAAREKIEQWLMGELKLIADVMGFRNLPKIKWGRTNLRDKNAERNLLIQLVNKGIISADSILQEFGLDLDDEMAKLEYEKELNPKNDVLLKIGPFDPRQSKIAAPVAPIPGGAAKPGSPGSTVKNQNGRPGGKTEPIKRQKEVQPRQQRGFSEYEALKLQGKILLDSLESKISDKFLRAKGLRYIKEAPQEEKARLEEFIYNVFSHAKPNTDETGVDDFLLHMLKNNNVAAKMKAEVLTNYHNMMVDYENKYGKPASREVRRGFITSAWTMCAINSINLV